jgi:hypothetical protein
MAVSDRTAGTDTDTDTEEPGQTQRQRHKHKHTHTHTQIQSSYRVANNVLDVDNVVRARVALGADQSADTAVVAAPDGHDL